MSETTIGYVTITYADDYISSHFLSSDTLRQEWEEMADEDKTVLLNKGLQDIEQFCFISKKVDLIQELQWPRFNLNIPVDIQIAQIEEAMSYLDDNDAYNAIAKGIKSETVKTLSTTYDTTYKNKFKLQSIKSYNLIKKYIKNTFDIR